MTGYKIVNLKIMLDELGEERTEALLSSFVCPQNEEVEYFLHKKAIEFSKNGFSQTHIVYASYRKQPVIAGYFTLANKYITVHADKALSVTMRKRIAKFSTYDSQIRSYCLSAPLIAQLGKNYSPAIRHLITGDELLKLACERVAKIQLDLGGRFAYLECEDTPRLIEFYKSNGFCEFDIRELDKDETMIKGDYLVQMLKYIKE